MTGRDLIATSLRKIGALASGETLSSEEATDGLAEFNRMLASWSNEGMLVYSITQETSITLVAGDSAYTLGTGGDLTNRPQSIESAVVRDSNIDYPVRILSLEEFVDIRNKSLQSTIPLCLYDDGGYPQRTITLYPTPSAAKLLILFTKRALTSLATIDTSLAFPPGYEDACVYNLAVRLAPEYGKGVSESIMMLADETKGNLKRLNNATHYLRADDALVGSTGRFIFQTGGYRRS